MRARGREATEEKNPLPRLERLNAPPTRDGYAPRKDVLNRSLIPDSAKSHSAELVALANKMWETLSYSNLSTIARLFREAMDFDPGNAAAFNGLSFALVAQAFGGWCALRMRTPPPRLPCSGRLKSIPNCRIQSVRQPGSRWS